MSSLARRVRPFARWPRSACLLACASIALGAVPVAAQQPVIIRGGWIFTAASDTVEKNRGIFVRAGRILVTNGDLSEEDTTGARVITLADDEYIRSEERRVGKEWRSGGWE